MDTKEHKIGDLKALCEGRDDEYIRKHIKQTGMSLAALASLSGMNMGDFINKIKSGGMVNIDKYKPCPCGSGKKYKFCCGKKG